MTCASLELWLGNLLRHSMWARDLPKHKQPSMSKIPLEQASLHPRVLSSEDACVCISLYSHSLAHCYGIWTKLETYSGADAMTRIGCQGLYNHVDRAVMYPQVKTDCWKTLTVLLAVIRIFWSSLALALITEKSRMITIGPIWRPKKDVWTQR